MAIHASLRRHYPHRYQGYALTRRAPPESAQVGAGRTPSVDRHVTPKPGPPQAGDAAGRCRARIEPPSLPRKRAVIEILQCLKKHGQRLDFEIAQETGVPLVTVRRRLAELTATGKVIMCNLTRFENGKPIDAWQCRVSGYVPPVAPGRKSKATM